MTGRRRLAAVALAACLLGALTGCPTPVDRAPEPSATPTAGDALPARPTGASVDLPAYAGPPPGAPPSRGPLRTVVAAVNLTPATPGVFARTAAAVAAPGGRAYVVLTPSDRRLPQSLVTVDATGAITAVVPMPRVDDVWGMHVLGDGTVAVTGQLTSGGTTGYGVQVADPSSGAVRATVAVPAETGTVSALGTSALGGSTLYLFLSTGTADGGSERLLALDVPTGRVLADRDLAGDVGAASLQPAGRQLGGLVPRPGGGVTLVFDAAPTEEVTARIPTLLAFDARLDPAGEPVRATDLSEGAEIQAVAGTADGTVFLLVEVDEGTWVLAIPDGGGAGPLLGQFQERIYNYALVVEPAQEWALLPHPEGVLSRDLRTGDVSGPLRFRCGPRLDVQDLQPGADGFGAVAIGECDDPREDTQMLWLLGP
ncbi:MAG TPA: hypothetical protein VK402_06075 [Blastococcus sp.]|nr:hypothetical protein [Blastococcus sp.]